MSGRVVPVAVAVAVVAAGTLPSAPAPLPPRPPRDLVAAEWRRLEGTWVVQRVESRGVEDKLLAGSEVVIGRDRLRLWGAHPTMTCRIDPSARPWRIDARCGPTRDYDEEIALSGVYRLDGGELTVCFTTGGAKRPTGFATSERSPAMLMVLKRAAGE
jgi:uncharacterized protein (TIGR03067 family)